MRVYLLGRRSSYLDNTQSDISFDVGRFVRFLPLTRTSVNPRHLHRLVSALDYWMLDARMTKTYDYVHYLAYLYKHAFEHGFDLHRCGHRTGPTFLPSVGGARLISEDRFLTE